MMAVPRDTIDLHLHHASDRGTVRYTSARHFERILAPLQNDKDTANKKIRDVL